MNKDNILPFVFGMALGIIILSLGLYSMFITGDLALIFGFTIFILILLFTFIMIIDIYG